jgi:hypothetical protein
VRSDFQVLTTRVGNALSFDALRDTYTAGSYSGLVLQVERGAKLKDVEFLNRLPNLRYLEISGSVRDDSRAFQLPELQELVLLTRSKAPVPNLVRSNLRRVGIDSQRDLRELSRLDDLTDLSLWLWAGSDFTFLGRKPKLRKLRVEGAKQIASLAGLDGCPNLEEVELVDLRVRSLAPLADAQALKRLWILGRPEMPEWTTLDLADLSQLHELVELRVTNAGAVRSVQPLAGFRNLRDFRIGGTDIADGDLSPLKDLSTRATVVGPNRKLL